MQLIRRTPRFGGLADLYVFHCSACDEWHVEEGDELASVPVSLDLLADRRPPLAA
jgi:hypothetical protein